MEAAITRPSRSISLSHFLQGSSGSRVSSVGCVIIFVVHGTITARPFFVGRPAPVSPLPLPPLLHTQTYRRGSSSMIAGELQLPPGSLLLTELLRPPARSRWAETGRGRLRGSDADAMQAPALLHHTQAPERGGKG